MIFKCIVVEDEDALRNDLMNELSKFSEIEIIGEAKSVDEAYNIISVKKPDVVFLDVKIIGGTGLSVLERLMYNHLPIPFIIMTTAYKEYAPDAINLFSQYNIKYFLKEELAANWHSQLRSAIDSLISIALTKNSDDTMEQNFLFLPKAKENVKVYFDDILWISTYGDSRGGLEIFTNTEKYTIDYTLDKLFEVLPKSTFLKIHRRYGINKYKVSKLDSKKQSASVFILRGEIIKRLDIGVTFIDEVLKHFPVIK